MKVGVTETELLGMVTMVVVELRSVTYWVSPVQPEKTYPVLGIAEIEAFASNE